LYSGPFPSGLMRYGSERNLANLNANRSVSTGFPEGIPALAASGSITV
jgi:hypothetical protein